MEKNLDFTYVTSGLEVSFRVLTKVPAKSIFDWDFGDDKGEVFNGGRHQSYSAIAPTLRSKKTNKNNTFFIILQLLFHHTTKTNS